MLGNSAASFSIADRIKAAQQLRQQLVANTDAYRLVHAEADFLPALIIDRYRDCFTVQALNQASDRALPEVADALNEQFQPTVIVARNDAAVRSLEGLPRETRILQGAIPGPVSIQMNGLAMEADLVHGQKTGVYLDQRENYAAIAKYTTGKALDCFTSTGGFALHMAKRCREVEAVDSSEQALATGRRNAVANGIDNITFRQADVFELLASYSHGKRQFDVAILDPPAFAKARTQTEGALRGYKDINVRALRVLSPGGLLVTCSCSHHISESMLLEVAAQASIDAGKTLRVLERRTQSADHPILLTVPETLYLKCLIFQVV